MRSYTTNLTDAQWALVVSMIPEAKAGGRPRSIDIRAVVNAIFYLLRTGCQWRLLPHDFPPWPTVYYYFRRWEREAVWLRLLRSLYPLVRLKAGRREAPSVAIMDGQSVKTTEKGAFGALTPISGSEEENGTSWSIR
jgi:putative transposase